MDDDAVSVPVVGRLPWGIDAVAMPPRGAGPRMTALVRVELVCLCIGIPEVSADAQPRRVTEVVVPPEEDKTR